MDSRTCMTGLPVLKIFLSSPGDVAEERALAEFVFRRLDDEVADVAHIQFLMWEHEPLFGHTGFQEQIERPSKSDLVVIILWSRLGMRLPADYAPAEGELAPTGTEFEINDALTAYAVNGKPNLLIYRKTPGPQISLGSEGFEERSDQFRRLDEYCRRTFYDAGGAVKIAHHSFSDSHDFERRLAAHVRRWVDQVLNIPHSERFRPFWRGESPFRGLRAFEAEHQSVYFGRSEAISEIAQRIRDIEVEAAIEPVSRLLLVQGMSGSGKTSLFKAGFLPRLALRPIEGIAQWITVQLRPSESDPLMRDTGALGVLATRLNERIPAVTGLGTSVQEFAASLLHSPVEAAARIEISLAADAAAANISPQFIRLFIYIDQLEEAFSHPDASVGEAPLIAAIAALCRSPSIWIAATIRSDFVHRLEAYPELMESLGRNSSYTLLPPRPDELAEMIREPARAAGLVWEERRGVSLDQELLRDATQNPEALPLLEYTLAELYERREGRVMQWSAYGGGLKDALIRAANEVVGDDPETAAAFRDVMRELVGIGEDGVATRRYASLARFPSGSAARALLDRLVERRLCVTTDEGRGDGPVASLAHEALIRSWPRAQDWLQQETLLLRMRDEMARDAAVWQYHDRGDGWLGVAPQKLDAIRQIERAGLMTTGVAAEYAAQSRRRGRRNRRLRQAALGGICTLTVIAVIAASLAFKQRNVARTEAATSDRTTQFMVGLFQLADPGENRGNAVTVKEVLDKGAKEIRDDTSSNSLKEEPRVRAELLTTMGQAYTGLGLYSSADELLKQAREDVNSSQVTDDARVRTWLASGNSLNLAGQYEDAEKFLSAAVDVARRSLAPSDPLRSAALTALADDVSELGRNEEAQRFCEEALFADRKRGADGGYILANTLGSLGLIFLNSGNYGPGETALREALKLRQKIFGERHALTAKSTNDLAVLLYQEGKYVDAASLYEKALPLYREVFGPEHPEVSIIINNIGRSDLMAGQVDEAEPLLRDSLRMTVKFGGDSEGMVSPLNSLAMIDAYRGHLDAAHDEIYRAAEIARLPDHGDLLDQVLLNQADIELALGNRSLAASLLGEAKKSLEKAHPDAQVDAWRYAVWDAVDAQLLAANGDVPHAAGMLASAQNIIIRRFGPAGFYNLLAKRRALAIAHAKAPAV